MASTLWSKLVWETFSGISGGIKLMWGFNGAL
jgi:hypothetical protein